MKVKNMQKVNKPDSSTKAFFSVETKNFDINDMRLVAGKNGLFVSFPSREYTNKKGEKKYQPIIWIKDTDFLKAINEEAVKIYNGDSKPNTDDIPF